MMRSRYKVGEDNQPTFITSTIIEWIPVFTRKPYVDILLNSLSFCRQQKALQVFAYVIMDNHLHLLAAGPNLSDTIRDFKRHTAREIIKLAEADQKYWLLQQFKFYRERHKTGSDYQVWQEGFHPQEIMGEEMLSQKLEYIHGNPVRAGWVERPEDWLYTSARNYLEMEAVLEIDAIEDLEG